MDIHQVALELTKDDKTFIWRVVDHAAEEAGSHAKLFANRLDYFEDSGRIKFYWPTWMNAIKSYLNLQYGEKRTESILLPLLREIISEPNYHAYLRQSQDGSVKFQKRP